MASRLEASKWPNDSIQTVASRRLCGSSSQYVVRPRLLRRTSPASERIRMCLLTAESVISKRPAISETARSSSSSMFRIRRRVGSESAPNTASKDSAIVRVSWAAPEQSTVRLSEFLTAMLVPTEKESRPRPLRNDH